MITFTKLLILHGIGELQPTLQKICNELPQSVASVNGVPTPPGKSWIFSLKFQDLESPGN